MQAHEVETLDGLRLMPSNVNLHHDGSVETWLEAIEAQLAEDEHPSLVVVDTLARNFVGGSENNPQDMGLFVEGVERIRRALKTAVLVIHHSDKKGDKERGTESLRNASFAMFKVTKSGGAIPAATLKCDRMKDAAAPPTSRVSFQRIDLPDLGEDASSLALRDSTGDLPPAEGESAVVISPAQRKVLQLLRRSNPRSNPRSKGLQPKGVTSQLGWRRTKATETLRSLAEGGFLRAKGSTRDRRYFLTEEGVRALDQ